MKRLQGGDLLCYRQRQLHTHQGETTLHSQKEMSLFYYPRRRKEDFLLAQQHAQPIKTIVAQPMRSHHYPEFSSFSSGIWLKQSPLNFPLFSCKVRSLFFVCWTCLWFFAIAYMSLTAIPCYFWINWICWWKYLAVSFLRLTLPNLFFFSSTYSMDFTLFLYFFLSFKSI